MIPDDAGRRQTVAVVLRRPAQHLSGDVRVDLRGKVDQLRQDSLHLEPHAEIRHEPVAAPIQEPTAGLGAAVVASKAYAAQQKMAGRVDLPGQTIARLIDGLAAAPGQRLPTPKVAALIGTSNSRVRMAISQVMKLPNIEGYPVVTLDPRTQTVLLNTPLLEEQFGVHA